MEFKRISIDTSKHIFTLHGVDDCAFRLIVNIDSV